MSKQGSSAKPASGLEQTSTSIFLEGKKKQKKKQKKKAVSRVERAKEKEGGREGEDK